MNKDAFKTRLHFNLKPNFNLKPPNINLKPNFAFKKPNINLKPNLKPKFNCGKMFEFDTDYFKKSGNFIAA